MAPAAMFRVAVDLLNQADRVREDHADVAAAIEADSEALSAGLSNLSVAQVAELLGQSRPTIYEWLKAGYLVSEEAAARGMSISPRSLMTLIPILGQWEEQGREGRPSRLLREWFEGANALRERRRASAGRRRAELINRRHRAGELAATH